MKQVEAIRKGRSSNTFVTSKKCDGMDFYEQPKKNCYNLGRIVTSKGVFFANYKRAVNTFN